MSKKSNDISILVEVARLYYEHNLSQQEIAKKVGLSRPGISRLLQRARDEGIVRIEINDPARRGTHLEASLKLKFSLKEVVVVPNDTSNSNIIKTRLGRAAVKMMDQLVGEATILGVSWGTTMQEVSKRVPVRPIRNMIVVQLNGGVSRAAYDTHASEVAQKIGENYRAIPYLLPLPAIVDSSKVKKAIISDKNIARTLQLGREASVAMYTVGSFGYESVLVKADYFESKELQELLEHGAVADICSRIINHDGKICSPELNDRTIGIELHELQKKPYSVAVAGGLEKLQAIKAALRGHLFNTLITDEWVANELLLI